MEGDYNTLELWRINADDPLEECNQAIIFYMGCESNIGRRRSGNWGSQIDYKKINEKMVATIQEFNIIIIQFTWEVSWDVSIIILNQCPLIIVIILFKRASKSAWGGFC